MLSQTSKLRLLEASQMWMPEVPTVRVAKNCDRLPGPGLTASRPSKLWSFSLANRSQGIKKPQPTSFHKPRAVFDGSGPAGAEGKQHRSKTRDGTVPCARLYQQWVHRPLMHRAPRRWSSPVVSCCLTQAVVGRGSSCSAAVCHLKDMPVLGRIVPRRPRKAANLVLKVASRPCARPSKRSYACLRQGGPSSLRTLPAP